MAVVFGYEGFDVGLVGHWRRSFAVGLGVSSS
jgi:hypothetical protein